MNIIIFGKQDLFDTFLFDTKCSDTEKSNLFKSSFSAAVFRKHHIHDNSYVDKSVITVSRTNFYMVLGDESVSGFRRRLLDFNDRKYEVVLSLFSSKY